MNIIVQLIDQVSRVKVARNLIRSKLASFGLATGDEKLDVLADPLDAIDGHSGETSTVNAGETLTIPKGYHDGTTSVKGLSAGGTSGKLQPVTVTASAEKQVITAPDGYDGFSSVTVNPVDTTTYQPAADLAAILATI